MGTLTYSTQEVQAKLDSINQIDAKFGTYPRPNLLDNWYFVGGGSQQGGGQFPINTRGQTSYSGINAWSIDKWQIQGADSTARVELNSNYLTIFGGSSKTNFYRVKLGYNVVGKKATWSVLTADGTLYTNTGTILESSISAAISTPFGNIRFNEGTSSSSGISIVLASGKSVNVVAAKMELGDTQTLAHQENGVWVLNEIPNYQQELEKCQRYQIELVPPGNSAIGCVGGGTPTSTTQCYVFVPTPTELRTVPTLTYAGTWKLVREGTAPASGAAVSAMSVVNRSANGVTLQITSSGLSTSYRYDLWYTAADTTNKLLLSANL